MPNAYSDGSYTTAKLVSNIASYPFPWPNNSDKKEFQLEYIIAEANYSEASYGSTDANAPSAYLVEKGPITRIAPGFIRFQRTYCQLPDNWQEVQQATYTFPGLSGPPGANVNTWNPYYYRAPVTLFCNATVYHNFSQSATSPALDARFQVTDSSNVVDYIGTQNPNFGVSTTSPSFEPATYIISSDASQIRAQIWEKVTLTVPKPA